MRYYTKLILKEYVNVWKWLLLLGMSKGLIIILMLNLFCVVIVMGLRLGLLVVYMLQNELQEYQYGVYVMP